MQFTTALIALYASFVFAAPAALEKRASIGVYLCNDIEFKGYCVHIKSQPNVCVPLDTDLNDKISSIGPDENSGLCYFYV
jgi:hypothetical protein